MQSLARNLVILMSIILLVSCGSGSFSRMNSAGNQLDGRDIWLVNKDEAAKNDAMFDLRKTESDSGLEVDIVTRSAEPLSQILLELHYDKSCLSVGNVNLKQVLGPVNEKVVFIHTDYPGIVAIGEARIGLTEVNVSPASVTSTSSTRPAAYREPSTSRLSLSRILY